MSTHHSPLLNGLRDITMEEWWRDPLIVADTLERKLEGLPVSRSTQAVLDDQIHLSLRILRSVGSKQYGRISILAMLDLLLAVDYFLVLKDEQRDSEDHGYNDDAERLSLVFKKHKIEIEKFRSWSNQC